ncbi:hypothetical protein HYV88_05090 [Candidatus Woesearchaeota archaeon]|nr:hypothetical protein [Candidatus Woesearchaeota archaeon]
MKRRLLPEQKELFDHIKRVGRTIPEGQYPLFLRSLKEIVEIVSRPYALVPQQTSHGSVVGPGIAYLSFNSSCKLGDLQDFLPGAKEMSEVPADLETTVIRVDPDCTDEDLRMMVQNCIAFADKKGPAYVIKAIYPGHNNVDTAKVLYNMLDTLAPDWDESMFCEDREWLGDVFFKIGKKWFDTIHLHQIMDRDKET